MALLALDTSTTAVTVAVHDGSDADRPALAERTRVQPNAHAELLSPLTAEVLSAAGLGIADIDRIAVGVGPGPFTGLRVGLVTAQVLALTRQVPVIGICSLDALAHQCLRALGPAAPQQFVVATDARRREVYWAGYVVEGGWARRVEGPDVAAPAALPLAGRAVFGRGAGLYPDVFGALEPDAPQDVSAAAVAVLAVDGSPAERLPVTPLYLRRPDAAVPGARKSVLP